MTLTEEEKTKIVEEERLRAQARQQYSSAPPPKKSILRRPISGVGCLVLIILGVILFFTYSALNNARDKARDAVKSPPGASTGEVAEEAAKQEALKKRTEVFAKVQLLNVRIEKNIIDVPELLLTIKNATGRDIDAVVFETTFTNNFGEVIRDWSGNSTYTGSYQEVIKNGATADISSQLVQWEHATKVETPKLIRVHFVAGEDVQ